MNNQTSLKDLYSFPGFRAGVKLKPHPGHPGARVVTLKRRQKKVFAPAGKFAADGTTPGARQSVTLILAARRSISSSRSAVSNAENARP